MRLSVITEETEMNDKPIDATDAEARFDEGCRKFGSGEWDEAYEIFRKLAGSTLSTDLANIARMATSILNPANSNETKARRILCLLLPTKPSQSANSNHGDEK